MVKDLLPLSILIGFLQQSIHIFPRLPVKKLEYVLLAYLLAEIFMLDIVPIWCLRYYRAPNVCNLMCLENASNLHHHL